MKKVLIITALCASALMAQTATALKGASNILNQRITFGGNSFLTLTTGKDTLSDPIVTEISTIRPGQAIVLEYFAIAADSTTSGYRIDLESRICTTPTTSVGCPSKWLKPRFRKIYNTENYADTAVVTLIPSNDTNQVSHTTFVPTGNQIRIRFRATTATSNYYRDLFLRAF